MGRVDPPNPVHTRPYGPARRSPILRCDGPLNADQADLIRERIRAAVPALDALLIDHRWSVAYPLPNHESTTP